MAQSQGVGKSTINNIWRAHKLQPYRTQTFKLSRDLKFLEKMTDVAGLYLNPPQPAIVLCVDEKSQIQALDRTQPGLPIKKGRCGTMTHDYKRHGTTTLFAALDTFQGKVVGECHHRHRQTRESNGVVATTSPVRASLRACQFQLVGSGREMVRSPRQPIHPPGRTTPKSRKRKPPTVQLFRRHYTSTENWQSGTTR